MLTILGRVTAINVRTMRWATDAMSLTYRRQDWVLPLRDPKMPEFSWLLIPMASCRQHRPIHDPMDQHDGHS